MSPDQPSQHKPPSVKHNKRDDTRVSKDYLSLVLFFVGLVVYLLTRFIHLPNFPIYFFTDEAIQTQHAADLIENDFRIADDTLLPTYFKNGGQYNLSLSVYAQVLPTMAFGKSIWVTRGVSVLISLTATISLALILKNAFQSRLWWLAPLLLACIPAWFLHSRTAFETVIMTAMYAVFLYFYLQYRHGKPWSLLLALLFGGLAFYAYSPGQVIVGITGFALLIADAKYHWQHRKIALAGLALLILLAYPYLRFILNQEQEPLHHLTMLNSYWVKPLPIYEKVLAYLVRYLKGLNPFYWFSPNPPFINRIWPNRKLPSWLFSNQLDLARHTMKGYGHIPCAFFPFWVFGLIRCIKGFKNSTYRTILLAALIAPSGAAVVVWGITRGMVFIIPSVIMIAIGLESAIRWLQARWKKSNIPRITIIISIILIIISFWMTFDALKNGPTWYDDYGMAGLQYGGQQVFTRAGEIARSQPETTVLVSSTWANGPDVLLRYYLDDIPNVRMGNINAFAIQYHPLKRNTLFIMTEEDLVFIENSDKFTNVFIEETLPYPDGSDGFYFVRLEYVNGIEDILAAERAARQALLTDVISLQGQQVEIQYSTLDMNEIHHAFDGDPTTVIRTLEANPLRIILTFPEPINLQQITVLIGGTPTRVTATAFADDRKLATLSKQVNLALVKRNIILEFFPVIQADRLEIEILNTHDGEIAHVHLWEVTIE